MTIAVITLVIVLLNTAILYINSTYVTEEMIKAHLNSVSILKTNQINNYVAQEAMGLKTLSSENELIDKVLRLGADSSASQEQDKAILRAHLASHLNLNPGEDAHTLGYIPKNVFWEFFIISPEGDVLVSTDISQEGKVKTDAFFVEGKKATYVQNFYYSLVINGPAMTISTPIKDAKGNLLGVLAGRINIDKISDIMTERSGLGETGETILREPVQLLVSKFKGNRISHCKDCLTAGSRV